MPLVSLQCGAKIRKNFENNFKKLWKSSSYESKTLKSFNVHVPPKTFFEKCPSLISKIMFFAIYLNQICLTSSQCL